MKLKLAAAIGVTAVLVTGCAAQAQLPEPPPLPSSCVTALEHADRLLMLWKRSNAAVLDVLEARPGESTWEQSRIVGEVADELKSLIPAYQQVAGDCRGKR